MNLPPISHQAYKRPKLIRKSPLYFSGRDNDLDETTKNLSKIGYIQFGNRGINQDIYYVISDEGLVYIQSRRKQNFFLWVHLF